MSNEILIASSNIDGELIKMAGISFIANECSEFLSQAEEMYSSEVKEKLLSGDYDFVMSLKLVASDKASKQD